MSLEFVGNTPGIVLLWSGALLLAVLGFVGARFRFWLAIPIVALVVFLSYKLTNEWVPAPDTETGREYTHVYLATALVLFATAQGLRSWFARRQ